MSAFIDLFELEVTFKCGSLVQDLTRPSTAMEYTLHKSELIASAMNVVSSSYLVMIASRRRFGQSSSHRSSKECGNFPTWSDIADCPQQTSSHRSQLRSQQRQTRKSGKGQAVNAFSNRSLFVWAFFARESEKVSFRPFNSVIFLNWYPALRSFSWKRLKCLV